MLISDTDDSAVTDLMVPYLAMAAVRKHNQQMVEQLLLERHNHNCIGYNHKLAESKQLDCQNYYHWQLN